MPVHFWNAAGTIAYIKADWNGTGVVGDGESWSLLGVCRGPAEISGTPLFDPIYSDTNHDQSNPADRIYNGTEVSVKLEIAKQNTLLLNNKYEWNNSPVASSETPNSSSVSGYYGTTTYENALTYDRGGTYELLLWSQVTRGGTVYTNYIKWFNMYPGGSSFNWGTRYSTWNIEFKGMEDPKRFNAGTPYNRFHGEYVGSTAIAFGDPDTSI